MTNPIITAVEPLRAEAIDRAEQYARKVVERVREELEAAGWDAEIVAPYPNSMRCGRREYQEKRGKRSLVSSLTVAASGSGVRSPRDPDIRAMDDDKIERFVKESREHASAQYDAFIAKLTGKVGECNEASLDGDHVWGYSILTVRKGETVERWKTQMILNVSKLGKLFNQFPTRKVK